MSERARKWIVRSWRECEGKDVGEIPLSYYRDGKLPSSRRRAIPQAVKVAVAARDMGQCQCIAAACHGWGMCGSTEEPHYDHITPWSRAVRIQWTTCRSCAARVTGVRALTISPSPCAISPGPPGRCLKKEREIH